MRSRFLTAVVLALTIGITAAHPARAADAGLNPGVENVLPSIVLVVQETTGTLVESNGTAHGPYDLIYAGTGFFISSNGYLVTAAHVAAPTPTEIHTELANAYIDDKYNCDPYKSSDQCDSVESAHIDDILSSTTVGQPSTTIQVLTQDMNPNGRGIDATVAASSPSDKLDTAVVKIAGSSEPVALLGGDNEGSIGTSIAVVGYPASAQNGPSGPTMIPTTTTGSITDLLPPDPTNSNAGSANLVRVDAHVEHGNSGGPAVDAAGNVIGIVSFGNLHNVNYLISIADVRSVVQQTPAANQLGTIDTLWRTGLSDLNSGDKSGANQQFKQCSDLNAAQVYCAARQAGHLAAGEPGGSGPPTSVATTTPTTQTSQLYGSNTSGVGTALLLGGILIAVLTGVVISRRRAAGRAAVAATWYYGVGAQQPPRYPPQYPSPYPQQQYPPAAPGWPPPAPQWGVPPTQPTPWNPPPPPPAWPQQDVYTPPTPQTPTWSPPPPPPAPGSVMPQAPQPWQLPPPPTPPTPPTPSGDNASEQPQW